MERWQNRVAVVTGASGGIGAVIAKDLAIAGLRVVALGRRQERLEENRSTLSADVQKRFIPRKCDVTNESEVQSTFKWICESLGGIDILVNNAGVTSVGTLTDMASSEVDRVLHTNVKGLIYCTQAAFKSMKERDFAGHIIHMNSVFGHRVVEPHPGHSTAIYAPAKFAVTAMNEIFRNEFRNMGTKIKTTSISPGLVRSEMVTEEVVKLLGGNALYPEDVSQAVLYVISTPPHVQVHELTIKTIGEIF